MGEGGEDMRFNLELSLEKENIPKDKNRMILSFLKHCFQSYDEGYYNSLYKSGENKIKSFTFSMYMPNCKFMREEIIIEEKKIILNFSTSDMEEGINFYNAVLMNLGKAYDTKSNKITAKHINLVREKSIMAESEVFKTMSPIVVRHHQGDNSKTWYYSLDEEKGRKILLENIKYQLLDQFGEGRKLDIDQVSFEVLKNKKVLVKNYSIEVLSNISLIKIYAKPYILDYFYKSGIGSKRSSGFGMLDLV